MPTIKLDGRDIPFMQGDTIIRAAHRAGVDVPHYCWHPGLSVAANCRMCLVEVLPAAGQRPMRLDILRFDEAKKQYVADQKPKLQPACQQACTDGMEVLSESSPHVAEARKVVQELLLLNHPVDCPICDQAGECRLQDYWLEHGRHKKRMHDEIVHKPKAVSFGPTIVYDAERCIVCTRCVRFVEEVAKDPVLDKRERGNLGEIFVAPGRQLDNNYTLMTEHVCPVGALTAKDFRFKARVWFLRSARTICQGCATGCNAYLDYDPRSQKAYRHRPRENEEVNKYWMCDQGMLSYARAHEGRITKARTGGETTTVKAAMDAVRRAFAGASADQIAIVLSAEHASEDNFALVTLAKSFLGAGDFFLAGAPKGKPDGVLMDGDHNANTKGAVQVASTTPPRAFEDLAAAVSAGKYTHVLAVGSAVPVDPALLDGFGRLAAFVAISAHEGPISRAAKIVLPACSWAEMDGTYVNAAGTAQRSERAIHAQGDSRPGWEWVGLIGDVLGYGLPFRKLGDLRRAMATEPSASLPPPPPASLPPAAPATTLASDDMAKFFTEYGFLVFGVAKIAIMLGFFLNIAPVIVLVERRQAALIQDRVGPNRARITVPGFLLKGALATPALAAALGIAYLCFVASPAKLPLVGVDRGFWMAELAVLLAWTHALVFCLSARTGGKASSDVELFFQKMEDPRWIFYTGLILHVTLAVAFGGLAGALANDAARVFAFGGPALLAGTLACIGAYVGFHIPDGPVDLRLAGLFHSIADAMKVVWKEDFIPPNADKLLHSLAPLIALFPALVTFAVIPFGDTLCIGSTKEGLWDIASIGATAPDAAGVCADHGVSLQIADLNVGILFMFAIAGTGIVGAAIAGWSSDNKWSLLGGLRAASQMVSYEVAMGLSLVGAFMIYGTPRLGEMVRWQQNNAWGIFVQPLAFFLFFASAIAEQKRTPFDAPEGESEIIAGYFVEYSSFKFLMFLTGEYLELVISSAVLTTIFFGGWTLPWLLPGGVHVAFGDTVLFHSALSPIVVAVIGILVFFGKVSLIAFGQIFIRWTVPRFRYDQIMSFGWKMLLPASIANIVVTGIGVLLVQGAGPSVTSTMKILGDVSHAVVVAAFVFVAVRFVLLLLSPVERTRFTSSAVAAHAARIGGVKEEPMGALGGHHGRHRR